MLNAAKQSLQSVSETMTAETNSSVVHLHTLRKTIGYLAVAFPAILVIGENVRNALLHGNAQSRFVIEGSISAYFHSGMREAFVGVLCAIGVFLVCYKGYQQMDNIAAKLAGTCAFIVALFPTPEESVAVEQNRIDTVTFFSNATTPDPGFVQVFHFGAAGVFFATLAAMSIFLFTKSDSVPTPRKVLRNRVYKISGAAILVCVAGIIAGKIAGGDSWNVPYVFALETVAIIAFGISWLVKGEVMLADSPVTATAGAPLPGSPVAAR